MEGFHLGTKKQHSATCPRISDRNQFNYCDECEEWFLPLSVSGGKGPPDKPGLAETIATYKKEFGDDWQHYFEKTVRVNLNYQYSEKE